MTRMVRAKAKMSYHDYDEENGASEGESYQGGDDSEEEFSDAPPAKKKKKASSAKKKVKKAKKGKKKANYTDDSDDDDIVAEVRTYSGFKMRSRPQSSVINYRCCR